MISVEEAQERILAAFEPLPSETVALSEAVGRVLAEDVTACVTQPRHDVSAMDGYAVQATDVATAPVRLKVVGEAPAGSAFSGAMRSGEAVRIFTGAPLPAGADTIVIQEDTESEAGQVLVKEPATRGTYVRTAGLDFRAGDVGVAAGRRLTPRDVGLAAAMNVPWLRVRRRPRVAILATGDEVVMPGEPLGPNQIASSNGLALSAFVTVCGGIPINLGIARDDKASLESLSGGATGSDLLVTCGGASVGEHDLVRRVLGESGLTLDFWKIAMRPGKPLMFGHLRGTPMLGLPGNPVSSLVCAVLLLRPALDRLQGLTPDTEPLATAILGEDLPANDRRQDYLRARLSRDSTGRSVATPFRRQDSSMLATLAHAECLIMRPPFAPAAQAGEEVEIVLLAAAQPSI